MSKLNLINLNHNSNSKSNSNLSLHKLNILILKLYTTNLKILFYNKSICINKLILQLGRAHISAYPIYNNLWHPLSYGDGNTTP